MHADLGRWILTCTDGTWDFILSYRVILFFSNANNENSWQLLDFYVFFYFFRTLFQDFPNFSTAFYLTYEQCSAEHSNFIFFDIFFTHLLLVFLRSRTSWSKLLIWDLPHRPVSRCVSVLQCLGRETPESSRKPWKMETRFHIKRFQTWENIMKMKRYIQTFPASADPGKHYFTWITLAYHCSFRLPMGCRTDKHLFIFVELRVLSRVWILQCIHFTHNLTLLIVDLYFMHCWSSLRILVYICIETDFWFYRSAAHLDSTVIYDGCDFGDSRIRPDQCASRRPEESTGAHFGSGHSLPHFDTILCSYTILCNFTSFPNRLP